MAIYREKTSLEVQNKPVHSITADHRTKVRAIVTNFITYLKASL